MDLEQNNGWGEVIVKVKPIKPKHNGNKKCSMCGKTLSIYNEGRCGACDVRAREGMGF